MRKLAGGLVVSGLFGLLGLSCGDSAPPVCPTGDCTLPGSTVVKWKFNHFPDVNFDSDSCSDLGVIMVHVEVTNKADATIMDALEKSCGEGQVTFSGLEGGEYNVAVTPLDIDGNALVISPATGMITAAGPGSTQTTEVDVNYPIWKGPYTGQLLFRLKWGGMSCPINVKTQTVTLTAGGQVQHATSQVDNVDYQKVDGTDPKPCQPFTATFPMNVMGLPFGPATLLVIGKDQSSMVMFQHTFDTFIGAGVFNPTLEFDAPPMDAGVDAPPDAPPDTM